jgi:lipopolysaccharide/colanic/teichoic acid biosynthesis glycosyltransferase
MIAIVIEIQKNQKLIYIQTRIEGKQSETAQFTSSRTMHIVNQQHYTGIVLWKHKEKEREKKAGGERRIMRRAHTITVPRPSTPNTIYLHILKRQDDVFTNKVDET